MEQKPIWEIISDVIDWSAVKDIPDWVDPRENSFWNKGRIQMPQWIQELSDWAMKTGNYKKIDELLDLRFGDKYKTPWSKEQIEKFKYGDKIKGLEKAKPNNKNLLSKYIDAINPREVYHRDPEKIIDVLDINRSGIRPDGSTYRPSFGNGAYVSVTNNPALSESYGDFVSRYYVNPESNLVSSKEKALYDVFKHQYFQEEIFGPKFRELLDKKGYAGIDNDWENIFYKPERDLLPANTKYQRFVNRFFNNSAVKYGGKILNKVATPLAIIDGIGFNQPAY